MKRYEILTHAIYMSLEEAGNNICSKHSIKCNNHKMMYWKSRYGEDQILIMKFPRDERGSIGHFVPTEKGLLCLEELLCRKSPGCPCI